MVGLHRKTIESLTKPLVVAENAKYVITLSPVGYNRMCQYMRPSMSLVHPCRCVNEEFFERIYYHSCIYTSRELSPDTGQLRFNANHASSCLLLTQTLYWEHNCINLL